MARNRKGPPPPPSEPSRKRKASEPSEPSSELDNLGQTSRKRKRQPVPSKVKGASMSMETQQEMKRNKSKPKKPKKITSVLELSYTLDDGLDAFGNQTGVFHRNMAEFFVDFRSFQKNEDPKNKMFQIAPYHPNYLHCYDVDPVKKCVFYECFDFTLSGFLDDMGKTREVFPIMFNLEVKTYPEAPEYEPQSSEYHFIPYIPDIVKVHIRALVDYLCSRHVKKLYTNGFKIEDIVIVGDTIKFHTLSIDCVEAPNEAEERATSDFVALHGIIIQVLEHATEGLPPSKRSLPIFDLIPADMKDFLKTLTKPSASILEIKNHVALWTHQQRVNFIMNIEHKSGLVGGQIKDALSVMPPKTDWKQQILPCHGPAHSLANAITKKGLIVYNDQDLKEANGELFRFLRNFIVHLQDDNYENIVECNSQPDALYLAGVLYSIFWKEIQELQEILSKADLDTKLGDAGSVLEYLLI